MADVKISQLPAATTPLAGTEEIPLVQSTTTKKVTVSGLLTTANLGTPTAINLTNATSVPVNQATGVLPVVNGGTGVTTPNIIGGTNISVTGTWPNQTVSATGAAAGNVTGPASATDNAVARYDNTTGQIIQNSGVIISDTNVITGGTWNGTPIAVSYGGTGTSTPSIVAGTNVTVSGTWPNQTINATAAGSVTGVTATAPVVSSGGTAPVISMAAATTSADGYLTSTDWNTFNGKLSSGGALGTPSSGTATNLTGLPLTTGVTGLLPVANGGTGTATPALVAGTNVTISGTWPNETINSSGGGSMTYPGAGIANSTGTAWGTSYTTSGTGTVVALATGAALTNSSANQINDTNGAQILGLSPTTSAVDYLVVKNGIGVGVPLHVYADGASANTGLHIQPKGTGLVTISDGTDFNKGIRFRSSSSAASAITLLDAVSTAGRVVTLPDATTTLVGRDTTDTLTNKTINLTSNTLVATSAQMAAAVSDETGSGSLVFATSPTLVTPALGTPSALVGTNITGTAAGLTAGNVTTNANLTGAVTSVGNATSLGSFTSANLLAALTDETGTGSAVFAISPTLVTPLLGTPTSATLTNATGLPLSTGVTGTLPVANGGTGLTTTPANGALDIGNGTGFTRTTLTAGTNITITNSAGGISIAASGGSATPGGSTTQVQYNNAGAFAGSAALTFDGTTLTSSTATAAGLIVNTSTAGKAFINFKSAGTQVGIVGLSGAILGTNATDVAIFADSSGGAIKFYPNAVTNNPSTFNQYGLGIGAAVPSSGIGITFPATQSTSSDGNTLDDYEEGTFTPTLTNITATGYTVTGKYVKIGRWVYAQVFFSGGSNFVSTANSSTIGGLPFTAVEQAACWGVGANTSSYGNGLVNSATFLIPTVAYTNNIVFTGMYLVAV